MKRLLKIGDRVAVYGADENFNLVRGTGTIKSFSIEGCVLFTNMKNMSRLDGPCRYDLTMPHPKQCRRLVKKECRRVWIEPKHLNAPTEHSDDFVVGSRIRHSGESGNWVEFVEVLKKKD